MKVLVIPEDPTHDEHVLKPVVEQLFKDLGRKNTRVTVLSDPHTGGVSQALDKQVVDEVLDRYPMMDLFLLIVDRDGVVERQGKLDARIEQATQLGKSMLGCLAIEEVEVWAMALHRSDLPDKWENVRNHTDPKETYFDPLVKQKGWLESKGRGRAMAMRALPRNWTSLKGRCPELKTLQDEIAAWLDDERTAQR